MYAYNAYNMTFVNNSKYYNAYRVMDHRQSSSRTYKLFKRVISKFVFVMFFRIRISLTFVLLNAKHIVKGLSVVQNCFLIIRIK